jgi:hypothetical protein
MAACLAERHITGSATEELKVGWVWQLILAHLWQLTLAHLWQFAKHLRGMEIRWASGWSVAEARSPARASISPSAWTCLSRLFAGSGSCRRQFR